MEEKVLNYVRADCGTQHTRIMAGKAIAAGEERELGRTRHLLQREWLLACWEDDLIRLV